jgi:hypothetical protein
MIASAIQSVGPPAERPAERVVAAMVNWVEDEANRAWPAIDLWSPDPRPSRQGQGPAALVRFPALSSRPVPASIPPPRR